MYRKDKVVQDLIGQGGGNADGDGANDNGDGDGTNADAALDAAVVELDAAVADADAAKRVELEALAAAKRAELAALAAAARELLESKGYTTVDQGMDTMACLVESDSESSPKKFTVGDRVEGDWQMEGTYYGGFVVAVSPENITIQYDDDASFETLPISAVRPESLSAYIERLRLMAAPPSSERLKRL